MRNVILVGRHLDSKSLTELNELGFNIVETQNIIWSNDYQEAKNQFYDLQDLARGLSLELETDISILFQNTPTLLAQLLTNHYKCYDDVSMAVVVSVANPVKRERITKEFPFSLLPNYAINLWENSIKELNPRSEIQIETQNKGFDAELNDYIYSGKIIVSYDPAPEFKLADVRWLFDR